MIYGLLSGILWAMDTVLMGIIITSEYFTKTNKIIFDQNKCKNFNEEIIIGNNIYYIDNPFIIDKINNSSNGYTLIEKKLLDSLTKDYSNNMLENIIDSVQNKEILDKIEKLIRWAVIIIWIN